MGLVYSAIKTTETTVPKSKISSEEAFNITTW